MSMVLLGCTLLLTGCSGSGVLLRNAETNIPRCTDRSPVQVASIADHASYKCDYEDVEFVFPDGYQLKAPGIADIAGVSNKLGNKLTMPIYELLNLGTYGVVADEVPLHGKHTMWWGTKIGLSKAWAAYGKGGAILGK
jgi:hypothetical protein